MFGHTQVIGFLHIEHYYCLLHEKYYNHSESAKTKHSEYCGFSQFGHRFLFRAAYVIIYLTNLSYAIIAALHYLFVRALAVPLLVSAFGYLS